MGVLFRRRPLGRRHSTRSRDARSSYPQVRKKASRTSRIISETSILAGGVPLQPYRRIDHRGSSARSVIASITRQSETRPPSQRAMMSPGRSEEHTSELQSLMRISYAVFCLTKNKQHHLKYIQHALKTLDPARKQIFATNRMK